jgi:hypothetical protein
MQFVGLEKSTTSSENYRMYNRHSDNGERATALSFISLRFPPVMEKPLDRAAVIQ